MLQLLCITTAHVAIAVYHSCSCCNYCVSQLLMLQLLCITTAHVAIAVYHSCSCCNCCVSQLLMLQLMCITAAYITNKCCVSQLLILQLLCIAAAHSEGMHHSCSFFSNRFITTVNILIQSITVYHRCSSFSICVAQLLVILWQSSFPSCSCFSSCYCFKHEIADAHISVRQLLRFSEKLLVKAAPSFSCWLAKLLLIHKKKITKFKNDNAYS